MVRLLAVFMFSVLSAQAANAEEPLEIGIWPYMSTRALLETYQPMQVYLEQRLHRPVLFVTAPDQKTFVERTQKGEYRFVVTAPHFARLAQMDAGYVPMLRAKRNASGVFVVDKNSTLHRVDELRGKTVTMTDRITLMSMLGLQSLRDYGLEPGRDVTVHYSLSHNSAVLAVLRGESAAAATSLAILGQMPNNVKYSVKVLAITGEVTPVVYLANPQVAEQEIHDMAQILLDFTGRTPEGMKFISDLGYQGLSPPTDIEMQRIDPYVVELRKLLEAGQ